MRKFYLYVPFVAAVFISCSDKGSEYAMSAQSEMRFSCGVAEYEKQQTRSNPTADNAASRTSFNLGDEVMISAVPSSHSGGGDYRSYKLTSSGWSTEGESFKWQDPQMRLLAYYPSSATSTSFTTPTDQSSLDKIAKADLMRVDAVVSQGDGNSVELSFSRQMAYVKVFVSKYGDVYEADERYIKDVKIYDYVVGEGGVVTTAAITPYEGTGGVYSALIKGTSGTSTPPNYRLITFKDAHNKEYYVENTTYLQPRYKHTISLLVGGNRDGVEIESVDVEPWSETIHIEGGDFDVTDIDPAKCIIFKDNALKSALAQQHNYQLPNGEMAEKIDLNDNGEIEFEEAEAVTQVVIGVDYDPESYEDLYKHFSNISEFRHLKKIGVMKGDLDLSKFPNLKVLNLLATNSRESYDFSMCPYLKELYLFATPATKSVNLQSNRYISDLRLRVEGLESLDLSSVVSLIDLSIENTPLLSLNLYNNELLSSLSIESSKLSSLDLSNNAKLKSLTLETNKTLALLNITGLDKLETLYCNVADGITALDLSAFSDLRSLHLGYMGLESLSLNNNSELTYLRLEESKIKELDISCNTKLSGLMARYISRLSISEAQSISPGVGYWISRIAVNGVVVVK